MLRHWWCAFALVLGSSLIAVAADLRFQGNWATSNRPLDGQMSCDVTALGKRHWQGRFSGNWQGVEFDYTVEFTGPPTNLAGVATIDGVAYQWRARMTRERFVANFASDRYAGSFDLRAVPRTEPLPDRPDHSATFSGTSLGRPDK